jgi:hypothetical protein
VEEKHGLLPQLDGDAPHRSRHFSADLRATKLQNHAIGVLQLNASSASRNGPTGSDSAV